MAMSSPSCQMTRSTPSANGLIRARNPRGQYTVVGIFPDSDWDSCRHDASFVEWIEAGTPLPAAQSARVQAANNRLIVEDSDDEATVNERTQELVASTEILAVFPGWIRDGAFGRTASVTASAQERSSAGLPK